MPSTSIEACARCMEEVSCESIIVRDNITPTFLMLMHGVQEGPDCGQGIMHTENPGRYLGPANT